MDARPPSTCAPTFPHGTRQVFSEALEVGFHNGIGVGTSPRGQIGPSPSRAERMRCFRPNKALLAARAAATGDSGSSQEPPAASTRAASAASGGDWFAMMTGLAPPSESKSGDVLSPDGDGWPPSDGWVTAVKQGTIFLGPVHEQLDAGERQQHIGLWVRHKAVQLMPISMPQAPPCAHRSGSPCLSNTLTQLCACPCTCYIRTRSGSSQDPRRDA